MNTTELKQVVERQIEHNKGKNLFHVDCDKTMYFTTGTIDRIDCFDKIHKEDERRLIEYATGKTLGELCRVNQYFSFNQRSICDLKCIYKSLLADMRTRGRPAQEISGNHYNRLKQWLQTTNPFAKRIYSQHQIYIQPVVCAEYETALQIKILQLNFNQLAGPVLDIGCGKQAKLVTAFQSAGFKVFGIDRFPAGFENIIKADWLDFNYGVKKWGTIVSHLGFSNHFNHHNLREDGLFTLYARKYMEILDSLTIGGSFHYSPALPFVEKYLDRNKFRMATYPVDQLGFSTTALTRVY